LPFAACELPRIPKLPPAFATTLAFDIPKKVWQHGYWSQRVSVILQNLRVQFLTKGNQTDKGGQMGGTPQKCSFSGHETFPFRYPWLKKGFDAVCEDGDVFLREDAITTLGVGKNMVRSIRHWCLAAGVLQENRGGDRGALKETDLGTLLLADDGRDPYLEDPATLWVLHW
jgi:hypothetical protein